MRLTTKILTVWLTLIVVLTIIAGWVSYQGVANEFQQQQRDLAREFSARIENQLATLYQQQGLAGVGVFLDNVVLANPDTLAIRLVKLDPDAIPMQRPRLPLESILSGPFGDPISTIGKNELGERTLYTYVPVRLLSPSSALEFAGSLAPLDQQMRRRVWTTLGSIGGLAFLSALAAYFTGVLWVARPLRQIVHKTEQIGSGNYDQTLQLNSGDELADLATALNELGFQLKRQQLRIVAETDHRISAVEQLRHADRLKTIGRLAAGLGHELGTPLNVISGRAAMIQSGRLSAEQTQECAAIIKSESERITEIVRQLLDFARPKTPQRAKIQIDTVARRTVELLRSIAQRRSVDIAFHDSTQGGSDGLTVYADAGQIQQVLTNIIVNAIQAIAPVEDRNQAGQVTIEIKREMACRPDAPEESPRPICLIQVSDSGPGFSEADLPHLFEPFFTTKDVGSGTGLGLSIAHGIVQEHHGWIQARNGMQGGAIFEVYLPMEDD